MDDRRPSARRLASACALAFSTACASTGATLHSGVGDAFPEHPPYYAGAARSAVAADASRLGYLPIVFQRGASQDALFDPSDAPGSPTAALLAEMTAYLDSLLTGETRAIRVAAPRDRRSSFVPPDVRFGCLTESGAPDDDCVADANGALGRGRQQMRLAVGRPSPEWTASMRDAMTSAGVERTLVITLEVGQMLPRQSGVLGQKGVELGTANTASLPWLTSLEAPVAVLQLTGALVDRDGKAIRIGAEGIAAKRTRFALSGMGAQELLRDEDVAHARTARRGDLPGEPLDWQVALRHLVAQLTGREPASR